MLLAFVPVMQTVAYLQSDCECTATVLFMQMEEDFVKANTEWVAELQIMVQTKVKAEIQALSSFGFQYLSQVYLPLKLQEGDWI